MLAYRSLKKDDYYHDRREIAMLAPDSHQMALRRLMTCFPDRIDKFNNAVLPPDKVLQLCGQLTEAERYGALIYLVAKLEEHPSDSTE